MSDSNKSNDISDLKLLVYSDRLRLLYQQSYPAIFTSIMTAIILSIILWPVKDHKVLLGWLFIMFITSVTRLLLFKKYHKVDPKGLEILSWETPYFITITLTTLTWGIGALFIMPFDSPLHQVIILTFLVGLSGAGTSLYSSHTNITITTILILLLPIIIYFLINSSYTFIGLSIAALGFLLSSVRATRSLGRTLDQNFTLKHQLEASKAKAEEDARIDHLTDLYNLRAFHEGGKSLANISQRNSHDFSLILMDIDHFKNINDSFGHAAGDHVLIEVADILKQTFRKSDICARIGGEEFAILLPSTTLDQAYELAEKVRLEIEKTSFIFNEKTMFITASFGLSSEMYDINKLLSQADEFLYQSKNSGRNTVSSSLNISQ